MGFFGIFLIWFINPLGVMFHSKSRACSFAPCAIIGLLIFIHGIMKTQILSKVSLCIFHNANHYKNNQNDQKQVNWSHFEQNIYLVYSLIHRPIWTLISSFLVIFLCYSVMKALILNMDWYAYGMILMTVKTLETVISGFGVPSQ